VRISLNLKIQGVLALCVLMSAVPAVADRFQEPPISYDTRPAQNPAAHLLDAMAAGTVQFAHDTQFGYLKSVLAYLKVPVESQTLVFSKTSLQQQYIAPNNPRAIYFNDDIYVGAVPGSGLIEISAADPKLGAVFYSLDQHKAGPPVMLRQGDNCLQCHGASLTGGIPGHMVRSVFTNAEGYPILKAGTHVTTQASPFAERWGGWYVTGTHGSARHMGNSLAVETDLEATLDREAGANLLNLPPRVNAANYLSPHSDIVALMVLEHQTVMHNLITRASYDTRFALQDQAVMDELLKRPEGELGESTLRRIASAGGRLVDHLLFADEVPLEAPVSGTPDAHVQVPVQLPDLFAAVRRAAQGNEGMGVPAALHDPERPRRPEEGLPPEHSTAQGHPRDPCGHEAGPADVLAGALVFGYPVHVCEISGILPWNMRCRPRCFRVAQSGFSGVLREKSVPG